MIEQDAYRHLRRLGHVRKPAGDGFLDIDLALFHKQVKTGRNESLGAAGDAERMVGPHGDFLELVRKSAGEQCHLLAGHADRQ